MAENETYCTKTRNGKCYGRDGISKWIASVSKALAMPDIKLHDAMDAVKRLDKENKIRLELIKEWVSICRVLCIGCPSNLTIT